jgi:hypothetical protein
MSDLINSTSTGMPYRWEDGSLTHSVEGTEVHPGIVLLWTKCGKDVPANSAVASWEMPVTCKRCEGESNV